MTLPKPLELTDSEILYFIHEHAKECHFNPYLPPKQRWVLEFRKSKRHIYQCSMASSLRQAVCQAAAILKEQENGNS